MKFPALATIEETLAQAPSNLASLRLVVLRNITIEMMEPYLAYSARQDGLNLKIAWGDFDNILQEASGEGSGAILNAHQAVVIYLWLSAFSNVFAADARPYSERELDAEVERIRVYCTAVIDALRVRTAAPILWIGFEPLPDDEVRTEAIAGLNRAIAARLSTAGDARLIDAASLLGRVGKTAFYDWRYWRLARAPLSRLAAAELGTQVAAQIRALARRTRKCLVLDCDNVLWGGIVGEDGVEGIALGDAFVEFQQEVVALHQRGVLVALCSKNNEADVLEVFRSRPEMVLREEHLSVMRINWRDKPTNLREISAALNIGLDSLVLADDSDFEIAMVNTALPEVATLSLPVSNAATNRSRLASCGWFENIGQTREDRARSEMYKAQAAREILRSQSSDLDQYLASLKMEVQISIVGDADLPRAAQLCERTNQFNLTTIRFSREELSRHSQRGDVLVQARLVDRFGDSGVVGFCMISVERSSAVVDVFLMSCRALGRGIETALLAESLKAVRKRGATTVTGRYIATSKNDQVAGFYERHGFVPVPGPDGERRYSYELDRDDIAIPPYLSVQAALDL